MHRQLHPGDASSWRAHTKGLALLLWGCALLTAATAQSSSPCPPCGRCRCCDVPAGFPPILGHEPFPEPALVLNCTRGTGRSGLGQRTVPDTSSSSRASSRGLPLWASFRLNALTMVQPLELPSARLLDLSDNAIRAVHARAFSSLRHLRRVSLASNDIRELDKKVFFGLDELEFVDLSQNQLPLINIEMFSSVDSLRFLNLSTNLISRIEPGAITNFAPELEVLDLSRNKLTSLEIGTFSRLSALTELYLSGNQLQLLAMQPLSPLIALQVLDVSNNSLGSVKGPETLDVQELRAGHNSLADLRPLLAAFPHLILLRVADNAVASIDGADLRALVELDLSGNQLRSLPANLSCPSLRRLDLSRCAFDLVPRQLSGAQLPALQDLRLDGNQRLQSVAFPPGAAFPSLQRLSLSALPLLQDVKGGAFEGLIRTDPAPPNSTHGEVCGPGRLHLRLSQNSMLNSIHKDAFQGLPLCTLDLSGNALETLEEATLNWTGLEWVDLQRNPWDCRCSMQWLVDVVVTHLYPTPHADLLYELRCSTPAALRDRRLVHFFNQSRPALCESPFGRMTAASDGDVDVSVTMGGSSVALGVVLGLCALLLVLIALGVGLTWRRRRNFRRRNRRF